MSENETIGHSEKRKSTSGSGIGNNTSVLSGNMNLTREVEIPKLKTSKADEYARWKRNIKLWERVTRISPRNRGAHIILNAIIDSEVHEVATNIDWEEVDDDAGVDNVLRHLDDHFKPNTFIRKMMLWEEFRTCVKRSDLTSVICIHQEDEKSEG